MKRFIFAVVVVFGILLAIWACAEDEENISWDEKYKDWPGVCLLKEKTVELKEDWSFTVKEHLKLKIQKEAAKELGEIPIRYNKSQQEVTDIEAFTITADGKKHKYSKIQDFDVYKGYPMYSDSKVKIVTMPEAKVGSIIEFEVTTLTKNLPIKNSFWYIDNVDPGDPMKENRLTVILPKKLNIKYKEFNLEHKPKITEDEERIIYSWNLKELKDREWEEFQPPPSLDNVKNWIEFSSIGSWSDISDWYYGLIQKNTVINKQIEDKVNELIKDKEMTRDKVRAILEYVQDDFRYVSMSLGDHTLEPHPTDEAFRNKYGDCKDLSLLCMVMLKIAGIDSNIALFNGEFSITDPQYDLPFPPLFNHVLLKVQDKDGNFYVDPLLDGYDIEEYPIGYQAAYTFVVTEDGGEFDRFPLFDERRNYKSIDTVIEIKEDGSAIKEARSLWDLDFSIETREDWKAMSQKERDKFLKMLDAYATSGGRMLERCWENIDERYGRVKSFVRYERPDAYPITGDMIIISSTVYGRGYNFTKEERENPIFCPANTLEEESITYIIPEGFEVMYVPKDLDLDIGFFHFKKDYEVDGNKIIIKEVARYRRKEIPRGKYKEVQDFFNKLPRETNQRIIVKKVTSE